MEAACLINDLKAAVKVSLFAGAALEEPALNASLALGKGTAALPGWQLAQGSHHRRPDSLQPRQPSASLISVPPGQPPSSGEPHSSWGSAEKAGCFLGKGQAPAGPWCGMLQRTGCFWAVLSGSCRLSLICRVLLVILTLSAARMQKLSVWMETPGN